MPCHTRAPSVGTGAILGPLPPNHPPVPACAHLPITGFDGFDHHGLFGVHLGAPLLWAGLCRGRTQGMGSQGHVV